MSANRAPCGHLLDTEPPRCNVGRRFPDDCKSCAAYTPGLTVQERVRCEIWSKLTGCAVSKKPPSLFVESKA